MSFLPPSDRTAPGPGAWRAGRLTLIAGAALLVLLTSCKDELPAPTEGVLDIALTSASAGGENGATVYLDDQVLIAQTSSDSYEQLVPAGEHRIRVEKPYFDVLPGAEQVIALAVAERRTVTFDLETKSGIEVSSNMVGADITLDGNATGEVTPATLVGLSQGPHTVSLNLLGANTRPDTTVSLGDHLIQLVIQLTPTLQKRGVLGEAFTATYCPYCFLADWALDSLETRYGDRGFVAIQLHVVWPKPDSLMTSSMIGGWLGTTDREVYPGFNYGTLPTVFFNGDYHSAEIGTAPNQLPALIARYTPHVQPIADSDASPLVAFYAKEVSRTAGDSLRGVVRAVVLRDLPGDSLEVWVADCKSGLVTKGRQGDTEQYLTYNNVVRHLINFGSLHALGKTHRGEWADFRFSFPLDQDTRWSEEGMDLVALAQLKGSREVAQVMRFPVP